jgi:hypothetical protein
MEAWTDLYQELADKIKDKLTDIQWLDLWHEQVSYLTEEVPFPTPAIFIAFNTRNCDDKGLLIQDVETQIDLYLFYETFSDTYQGSYNKDSAIDFLKLLTKIHTLFHGKSGENFGTLRRTDMKQEESGGSGNLYRISFECVIEDASAQVQHEKQQVNEVAIINENPVKPSTVDANPLYAIET